MALSVIPSAFSEPMYPDSYCCHKFYATPSPAKLADCRQAFNLLPSGSSLIPWSMHAHHRDPHFLPFIVRHDTCSIQFQASGPSAEDLEIVYFSGNDMRNMAGWLIDQCISDENLGGFATHSLANAEDYITNPTVRYEDTWRKGTTTLTAQICPSFANICSKAAHTSFFSLQLWNDNEGLYYPGWNPGNMDPDVSDEIVASLDAATDLYPRGSAARANSLRNYEYFQAVRQKMKAFDYNNWWQWLPSWRPKRFSMRPDTNTTSSTITLTNPSINVTAACSREGGERCGSSSNYQ